MNILLVGLGKQGSRLLKRLSDRGHHVEVAVPNRRSSWDRYLSYLNDPIWDAVFICSDDDTHEMYAQAAFANHKHVYVEKPVGSCFDETRHILQSAKDFGRVFCAGYTFLWHPILNELANESLDNWHFRWTKPTKSKRLDRSLMSHHISMAIMAWGRPIYSNIIQTNDRCLGQFIFDDGKTMNSNIRLGNSVVHEAEVRQATKTCTYNLQHFNDPDPISKMLAYFETSISKLNEHKLTEWDMSIEHLTYEVARVLNG